MLLVAQPSSWWLLPCRRSRCSSPHTWCIRDYIGATYSIVCFLRLTATIATLNILVSDTVALTSKVPPSIPSDLPPNQA